MYVCVCRWVDVSALYACTQSLPFPHPIPQLHTPDAAMTTTTSTTYIYIYL
jgi:hypothetical protein